MAKLVYTDQSGREITELLGPDHPVITIGRAKDCTIRSNRKSVSRRHAEFHYNEGRYEVVDLDSSNGTYLIENDQRKPVGNPEILSHGDEVWCGDFILYFVDESAEARSAGVSGGVQGNLGQPSESGRQQPVSSGGVSAGGGGGVSAGGGGGVSAGSGGGVSAGGGGGVSTGSGGGVSAGSGGDMSSGVSSSTSAPVASEPAAGNSGAGSSSASMDVGTGASADSEELRRLRDEKESIQNLADRQSNTIDELEDTIEALRGELDDARQQSADSAELDQLRTKIDNRDRDLEILERELEREVEEKQQLSDQIDELRDQQHSDAGRVEELQARIDELNQQLQQRPEPQDSAVTDEQLDALADHARTLDRIVDAIVRTDLGPLSTVDRVRLESAIRDTEPRNTLSAMLEIIGADDPQQD